MSITKEIITEYVIKEKEKHYRLAYSYVKDVDNALDIVQESIYKAFSSMDSLREPQYIKTWFYRIVVNTSLDFLRRNKRLIIVDDFSASGLEPSKIDNYKDFDLQRAIESLPEKYRSIIILRFFEDLKLQEISQVLDKNISTVKTQLYKALEILRLDLKVLE